MIAATDGLCEVLDHLCVIQHFNILGSKGTFSALRHELSRGRWFRRSCFLGQQDLDKPNATGRQGEGAALPLGQPD